MGREVYTDIFIFLVEQSNRNLLLKMYMAPNSAISPVGISYKEILAKGQKLIKFIAGLLGKRKIYKQPT